MATEISAAISAYSIAVLPLSSRASLSQKLLLRSISTPIRQYKQATQYPVTRKRAAIIMLRASLTQKTWQDSQAHQPYFRLDETLLKVPPSLVPTLVTPAIMATAMRAAMRPYSIAVAPDSFFIRRTMVFIALFPPVISRQGHLPKTRTTLHPKITLPN